MVYKQLQPQRYRPVMKSLQVIQIHTNTPVQSWCFYVSGTKAGTTLLLLYHTGAGRVSPEVSCSISKPMSTVYSCHSVGCSHDVLVCCVQNTTTLCTNLVITHRAHCQPPELIVARTVYCVCAEGDAEAAVKAELGEDAGLVEEDLVAVSYMGDELDLETVGDIIAIIEEKVPKWSNTRNK